MKTKKTIDIDEQNEGVSYEKGREFERQFAEFMKNELGWKKVRVGAHMPGKDNVKGTSIDIFAERLDDLGKKYESIAINWMLGSFLLASLSFIWYMQDWGNDGLWFLILCLISILGGLVFMFLSEVNNKQNAWVECKNLKSKANINHISKMIRELNDFKLTKSGEHRFTHYYFASANGYVENAIKTAMANNIICYVKNGNSFEEIKYWDEKDDSKNP